MYKSDRTDVKACEARLRQGSSSFFAASCLLPARIRQPAAALYAFCRLADDAVDQGPANRQTLAGLRYRLAIIYSDHSATLPEDRAFAQVVKRFGIPSALPEALLEGFEWDIDRRSYHTLEDLHDYSARVAGTVGAMMAIIMGVRAPAVIARACELGMAMQLTNIARDVGEDAREGRLYLPRQWLLEVGIDPDVWLQSPCHSDALGQVVQRLLRAADDLYARADAGIASLPPSCRVGIRSARLIYTGIGRDIEQHGLDSVSRRAFVPAGRKVSLVWRALLIRARSAGTSSEAIHASARFLADAVRTSPEIAQHRQAIDPVAWWELHKRFAKVVEIFDQLERREQAER